jgi:hypothetical protein
MKYFHLLILSLLLLAGKTANAQRLQVACDANKTAPPINSWHWPEGTLVKVQLIRSMFKPSEQAVIREVMSEWNDLSEQLGIGIKYAFAGEVDEARDDFGQLTLTRIEIMKGTNNKFFAYFFPTRRGDGLLRSAVITIDFNTTDTAALKSFVAHEIAHGMGLFDCKSCKSKSTIMRGFPGVNEGNGLVAPSACDVRTVKSLFEHERTALRFSNHQPIHNPRAAPKTDDAPPVPRSRQ